MLLLTALLAFSWQSIVAQSHVHFDARTYKQLGIEGDSSAARQTAERSPADLPADCPICREIAHAGHYLQPAPLALAAPETGVVWIAISPWRTLTLRQRRHAWHSRAPPNLLQA